MQILSLDQNSPCNLVLSQSFEIDSDERVVSMNEEFSPYDNWSILIEMLALMLSEI